MAYATGTRIASLVCFLVGAFTLVGIPILWPLGWFFGKKAEEKERERESELAA